MVVWKNFFDYISPENFFDLPPPVDNISRKNFYDLVKILGKVGQNMTTPPPPPQCWWLRDVPEHFLQILQNLYNLAMQNSYCDHRNFDSNPLQHCRLSEYYETSFSYLCEVKTDSILCE